MSTVVTGAGGFIGSTLTSYLLERGEHVTGVDSLTDYYPASDKRRNLAPFRRHPRFRFLGADLARDEIEPIIDGAGAVFHIAGQPGVRPSWSEQFDLYLERNITATQRLLEAARRVRPGRIVVASSSSVYGDAPRYPTTEDDVPAPRSPYGVTKLAAEHLCALYGASFSLPTVALRYFTVYGPRQRPDMAFHRLFEAALDGTPFPLLGSGRQRRDFTFVADVVRATVLAGTADIPPGWVMNIAGEGATLTDAITMVEDLTGRTVRLEHQPAPPGDVDRTGGSIERARRCLGWEPRIGLREGLAEQCRWHLDRREPDERLATASSGGSVR